MSIYGFAAIVLIALVTMVAIFWRFYPQLREGQDSRRRASSILARTVTIVFMGIPGSLLMQLRHYAILIWILMALAVYLTSLILFRWLGARNDPAKMPPEP